jgi:hypothetical protein
MFATIRNIKLYENPLVGAEFFHAERRTDMTKLIVAIFFVNPYKKGIKWGAPNVVAAAARLLQ